MAFMAPLLAIPAALGIGGGAAAGAGAAGLGTAGLISSAAAAPMTGAAVGAGALGGAGAGAATAGATGGLMASILKMKPLFDMGTKIGSLLGGGGGGGGGSIGGSQAPPEMPQAPLINAPATPSPNPFLNYSPTAVNSMRLSSLNRR